MIYKGCRWGGIAFIRFIKFIVIFLWTQTLTLKGRKTCSETYVTDFLAALVSLILWGFQNRGELVLGPLILLPVLPLIEERLEKQVRVCCDQVVGLIVCFLLMSILTINVRWSQKMPKKIKVHVKFWWWNLIDKDFLFNFIEWVKLTITSI